MALTFLSHLRVERAQGTFDHRKYMVASPLGFSVISEQFLKLKENTCKPSTLRKYQQYTTICCGYFNDVVVSYIDHKQLQLFIHSLNYSTYRVKCILDYIMELLRWCYDNGDIPKVPKRPAWKWKLGVKPIIGKDLQAKILGEIYAFYSTKRVQVPRCAVAIEILCTYPKIRPGELRQVKEKHINLKTGTITIPSPKEGREPKTIILIEEHIELLRSLPKSFPEMYFLRYDYPVKGRNVGDRFGKDYLYYVWRRACKRLGVKVDLYRGTKHSTITEWSRNHPLAVIERAANVSQCIRRYIVLGEEDVQRLYQEAKPNTKVSSSDRRNTVD